MIIIAKHPDLTGQTFGHLKVIEKTKNKKGIKSWLCECDCENKTQLVIETGRLVSGRKTHCGCQRTYKHKEEINIPNEYLNKTKICSECGQEREYKDFYFNEYLNEKGIKTYYFHPQCVDCERQKAREYGKKHKTEKNKRDKEYNQLHKEIINERSRKWREDNAEWKKEYQADYWKNNPERVSKYNTRRRHKKHKINKQEWKNCKQYFDNSCAYCGLPEELHRELFKTDLHKEHVDHEGLNDLSNCVPSCESCNYRKWEHEFEDWYNKDNSRFTKERYEKILKWLKEDYKKYYIKKKPRVAYGSRKKSK